MNSQVPLEATLVQDVSAHLSERMEEMDREQSMKLVQFMRQRKPKKKVAIRVSQVYLKKTTLKLLMRSSVGGNNTEKLLQQLV